MGNVLGSILDSFDTFIAWLSSSLKQTTEAYCDLETADNEHCLIAHDGSMISFIKIEGCTTLLGTPEFNDLHQGLSAILNATFSRPGYAIQVFFQYEREQVSNLIADIFQPAIETAKRLDMNLDDLFEERVRFLSQYCAEESVFFVLWTKPSQFSNDQFQRASKEKMRLIKEKKIPPFLLTQNLIAPIPELRDAHESYVRSVLTELNSLNVKANLLEVHDALYYVRMSVDPEITDRQWRPLLPGDKMKGVKEYKNSKGLPSDLLWPPLSRQIFPRDAESLDLRTVRIGDRIYTSVFIDLFPKDIKTFIALFQRVAVAHIPWRISFLLESDGLSAIKFKGMMTTILSFASAQNRLINDSIKLLKYFDINTDDSVVRLRVVATTWAPEGNISLLRTRVSELSKAIQGWGGCDTSEVSGDPLGGVVSSILGITCQSEATATIAPLSHVVYMLPVTRHSSPWEKGAILFRTPDGKPWPFQPGSRQQTTWIDLVYARPGSGKSVLSNMINLALCLSAGIQRLPRIAIIDIGPSSSGLISLLKEALPYEKRHLVAYHRLRMTPDYSINPFDTQLGCRFPTAQERGFLVNFLTLLSTPLSSDKAYDGIGDLAGMVVDELYKQFSDSEKPTHYTAQIEPLVDGILEEIGFVRDQRTTWWEVTDALFNAGFVHEAMLAQRYAMPLLADAASIVRISAIDDLYGKIIAPTGETLIAAFGRMISAAVREYPILSRITCFDLGESRVVSLDLDEVAKSGGEAADRQTAVMYMLARYVLAKNFYLTQENVNEMPELYRTYHTDRIAEVREDPKRLVYDEFHRTAKSKAVRDQVVLDMREGRKWKVQIALLSQSVDDFDSVMVEFATAIYIMDAGPSQAIKKSAQIFGLSETAVIALRTRVHGPREGGATFLVQYATKDGINLQLLTCTLGPIELWAFSTTTEDSNLRNRLYKRIGPSEGRRVLANIFPSGTATKLIEERMNLLKQEEGLIEEVSTKGIVEQLAEEIVQQYMKDPDFRRLPV